MVGRCTEHLSDAKFFCWHCHTGIFSYPARVAIDKKIPLVIWGEPSAEYSGYYNYEDIEYVDARRFNRFVNLGISAEDMSGFIGCKERELSLLTYPSSEELARLEVVSVCLGSFIPWNTKKQSELITRELGWVGSQVEGVPPSHNFEKVECLAQGCRDFLRFCKRSCGRTASLISLDLRRGEISKEQAQIIIDKYDGFKPHSLSFLLKLLDMSESELEVIIQNHIITPHTFVPFEMYTTGQELPDEKEWFEYFPK